MRTWLLLAGTMQLAIVAASLAVPRVLDWRNEMRTLTPLTRTVFWTYAGYIVVTNLALALVALQAEWLLMPWPLSRAVAGYGALYWGARLVLQFACYRRHAPRGRWYVLADVFFSAAFAYVTAVFSVIALR